MEKKRTGQDMCYDVMWRYLSEDGNLCSYVGCAGEENKEEEFVSIAVSKEKDEGTERQMRLYYFVLLLCTSCKRSEERRKSINVVESHMSPFSLISPGNVAIG